MTNRNFTNFNEFLNIRYIRRVDSMYMDLSDFYYMIERFKKIYEENTKLEAEIEKLKGELKSEREFRANVRIELLDRKAEIEQLKSEIEQWQSTNFKLVCELTRVECENNQLKSELEQLKNGCDQLKIRLTKKTEIETQLRGIVEKLKSELEQSVKLPCKVGDVLYSLFLENIKELTVIQINIGMNKNQNSLVIITKNERGANEILELIDFGKTVFLTREEAEQHLKGKVEE